MINNYTEITGKYLRANKKRTGLTLIGIILSVSLISSIGFFIKSMQETQIQDMKNTYGSWHVMYEKADESLITKIKNNPITLRSGTYTIGEFEDIEDKLKARVIIASGDAFKMLPYKLKEGRFPENDEELVAEKWFLEKITIDSKLGDKIKVLNKEYTLVGILNNSTINQYKGLGELLTFEATINSDQKSLLVELTPNSKLKNNIDELKALSDEKLVTENELLVIAQGQGMPKGMIVVLTIIIGIVVLATIAVIYNAFQISVVERIKQFGLLRAVGATPKQIRKVIVREATFLAVIGIPIGLGFGILAIYGIDIAFNIIGGTNIVFKATTISSDVVLISILIGLLSIYISAFLPAIFAGKISPLIAISSRTSITKEKVKRRKNFILERLFGFEGALAAKNMKRNRKRYRITVFSIVISVTLFISFKSFMDMSFNVYSEINESDKIHFSIETDYNNEEKNNGIREDIIQEINNLSYTDTSYKVFLSYYFDAVFDNTNENRDIRELGTVYQDITYNDEIKTQMGASLVIYDEKSFEVAKGYLKEGEISLEELNGQNGVIIIGKNRIYNEKTERTFYGPVASIGLGDQVFLQSGYEENGKVKFGQGEVNKVKVLGVLESDPFDFSGDQSKLKILTTIDVAKKLTNKNIDPVGLKIKLKDIKHEEMAKKRIESIINDQANLSLINNIDRNRTGKSGVLMAKILLYGFVVVVTLISTVNIINTLTTNIILRRKEFAILKSIGLTQKGLRKMITLEGMLYGIYGTIYGSVFGSLLSYALFKGISDVREQSYQLPLNAILIATIGAILIGYLSVLAPIRRMRKDNLIDVVREDI